MNLYAAIITLNLIAIKMEYEKKSYNAGIRQSQATNQYRKTKVKKRGTKG